MCRLEGFRLIAPQGDWERFWIIQFPTHKGAEAWIEAEMAPPYGQYGFYDYQLSRQHLPAADSDWLSDAKMARRPLAGDPRQIPALLVDRDSVVVFLYESGRPGAGLLLEKERVPNAMSTTSSFAKSFGVKRLERFDLVSSKTKWNRVLLVELPTLDAAEAWIESMTGLDRNSIAEQHFQITRKWGEDYFASWIYN